jgi:hypothetical protein
VGIATIGSGIGGLSRDLSAFWSNLTTVVSGDGIGRNSSGCFCGIALWHDNKVLHAITDSALLIFRRSTRSRLSLCELSIQLQLEGHSRNCALPVAIYTVSGCIQQGIPQNLHRRVHIWRVHLPGDCIIDG